MSNQTNNLMKKLEHLEMTAIVGGDFCGAGQNVGIVCYQARAMGQSFAVCFTCGGDFLYAEIW